MEGMILAAGLGTRLRPLTDRRPKALVEIQGRTLLELAIRRLEHFGIDHIVVNVHHFGDQVIDFVRQGDWKSQVDISDERDMLMDTGGALSKAAGMFSSSSHVVVHNVDILSTIDLADLELRHKAAGNLATLCVSRRTTKRMLIFDEAGCLMGRQGEVEAAEGMQALAFSGVSIVSPKLFGLLPPPEQPFSIIPQYIALSRSHRIGSYLHEASGWLDVGKPETLKQAALWNLS